MKTKKQIHAESRLSLPRFSFPRFFILFLQRFRGVGAKGPEIEFLEIASAFLFSAFFSWPFCFLVHQNRIRVFIFRVFILAVFLGGHQNRLRVF